VVIAADGQVTLGDTVLKTTARKVRTLHDGQVLAGFSGSTADAITLFERFESRLKDLSGNLARAAVELAKDWRTDKSLRRLEALLLVANGRRTLVVSGNGDVVEPDGACAAIGSGGSYALAAARALVRHAGSMDAEAVARAAMGIAAEICIYTNEHLVVESIGERPPEESG
jgi:ATP-dependent HslUV protease subunit HslV